MPTQRGTVAEFLAALNPERRAEVEGLREIVRSAHPELVEAVKWNSPNWSLDGADLLTVNVPRSGPVRLILHRGVTTVEDKTAPSTFVGDPDGLLRWHSDIRASLSMPAPDELEGARAGMVEVIRSWVETS
jgi:Domain of unknown function (DU1801)